MENISNTIRQVVREEMQSSLQNYGTQGGTPNKTVTCYSCNEEGHISRNCPFKEKKTTRSISRLDVTENENVENFFCDNAEVEDKSEN